MKRLVYVALALAVFNCSDDDKKSTKTKTELLTGGSSKTWQLTAESPDDVDPNCRPSSDRSKDNTWTFFESGDFTFDNGTITETETCSDVMNFSSAWMFSDNETRIFISHPLFGEFSNDEIVKLEESELVLRGPTGFTATFTPR